MELPLHHAWLTALCRCVHKRVSPLAAEPPPSLFVGDRSTTTIVCYYVVTNDGLFWCESRKRRRLTEPEHDLALHTMALALHPTRACLSLTKRGGIVSSLQPPAFRLPPSFGLPNKFWVTNSIYSTLYVDVLQRHKPQLPPEVEAKRRNSYCITPLTTQHFFTSYVCTL